MFSTTEKTKRVTVQQRSQSGAPTYFRRAGEPGFFGARENHSFFPGSVQAKLSVSQPGDPQEVEADAVADKVMRMHEPAASSPVANKEEKIQRKEEEEQISLSAETPMISVQRKEKEEEHSVQAKGFNIPANPASSTGTLTSIAPGVSAGGAEIGRKAFSFPHMDIALQNSRGPPQNPVSFERSLLSNRGTGIALPGNTREFMESRFRSDFSEVRIHTGSNAEGMARQISAQAFTYGNDIYFNEGRFSPETATGGALLAHELSHTIQQGSSKQFTPAEKARDSKNKKESRPERPTGKIIDQAVVPKEATVVAAVEGKGKKPIPGAKIQAPPAQKNNKAAAPTGEPAAEKGSAKAGPHKKSAPVIEIMMPEPPTELNAASKKRVKQSQGRASSSATTHADLPDSGKNVGDARGSVEQPKEEINAKAGEDLVAAIGQRAQPSPEILALCDKIRKVIKDKRPPDEDSLVDADPEASAKEAGGDVKESIDGKVDAVDKHYDDLQQKPEGKKEKDAEQVVDPPGKVDGTPINAANAVPDAVPPENISLDGDVASTDQKITESGMTTEPAKMVQDGPIAEARDAHAELGETAASDPAAVEAAQKKALSKAGEDMNAIQDRALKALQSSRTKTIEGVGTQQKGMKESEEDKRKRVGDEANKKFQDAQKNVTDLLSGLTKGAMNKWEAGVAISSSKFKATLKKVKDWIDDRHSGVGGFFNRIGDAIGGLPDWVTEEYDRAEKLFGDEVCDLIIAISTEVNTVIASCQLLIDNTQKEIARLFHDAFGDLNEWANQQLGQFDKKIKLLHAKVEDTKNQFNKDLAGKASKSVQDVREEIFALREKAKGLIGRIAGAIAAFIDDPAKFILEGLLSLLGIPIPAFWRLVNKIKSVISEIADDPMKFANNLMDSLGKGFSLFIDHFGTHLKEGFIAWLTSGFGSVGVQLPPDFSLPNMIMFFLQLMGISWERIRKLLAKHIGEENVEHIEKAFAMVSELIKKGPDGILEFIKQVFDPKTLLAQIMDSVIEFVVKLLVERVAIELLKLFNPVGAILKAIEAIYAVFKWIFENAAKIFTLVETVVNGIANILSGNITGMALIVEKALTMLIAPIIDFLADLIGLGGLPEKIAELIKGLQGWVEGILDKAIGWLANQAKKLLKKLGIGKDKKEDEAPKPGDTEVGKVIHFTAGEEQHKLWVDTTGSLVRVMLASDKPGPLGDKAKDLEKNVPEANKSKGKGDEQQILSLEKNIIHDATESKKKIKKAQEKGHSAKDNAEAKTADDAVENKQDQAVGPVKELIELVSNKLGTKKNPYPLYWPTLLSHPPVASDRPLKKVANSERDTNVAYVLRQKEILFQFAAKEDSASDSLTIKQYRRGLRASFGIKAKIKDYNLDGHLHHIHPLFLDGTDNENTDFVMLDATEHLKGHDILRRQTGAPPPPQGIPTDKRDLYDSSKHPNGTYYIAIGNI